MSYLTDLNLQNWKDQGFLKLSNIFNTDELDKINLWIEKIEVSKQDLDDGILHYYEKTEYGPRITRSERFLNIDSELKEFLEFGKISKIIEILIGEQVVLFKEKLNYKYPGGAGYIPHQDVAAYYATHDLHSKARLKITCLLSPFSTDEENGCLYMSPGNHTKGLLKTNDRNCIDKSIADSLKWIAVPTNPGDILFFNSYTPHFSKKNNSNKNRKSLYLSYNALSAGRLREDYYKKRDFDLGTQVKPDKKKISTIDHFDGIKIN